ncbi:twin transmembrane helix small protein [Roseibium litorale]|uniref:Twin transmembrane helix small protein n=1 Tax=Roseibium litorale TaxID=2803841 RepID=A0ABR9CMM1_9HYPH|nr:twin transmembrane helix small protein [Roseibium litorale]MBD8891670.1 twin transmembrane helix small protein [Roseibium litorale]
METIWNYAIPVAMGAVALVLLMGLWNMFRGGSSSRSQTLMRWRVGLQFLVIVLVMTGVYFFGQGR